MCYTKGETHKTETNTLENDGDFFSPIIFKNQVYKIYLLLTITVY